MQRIINLTLAGLTLVPCATAQWTSDQLSLARYATGAASAGTFALFAGGVNFSAPGMGTYYDTVDVYDQRDGQWETMVLSQARSNLGAAGLAGRAYFAGGYAATGLSDVVDIFDAVTQTWSTATLSFARAELSGAATGGFVAFGGGMATVELATVDLLEVATGTWSTAQLSVPRSSPAAVGHEGLIFFAGGQLAGTAASDAVDIFDTQTQTWSTATLSEPRQGLAAAAADDFVLFAGGRGLQGVSDVVDVYRVSTGQWSTLQLSQSRTGLAGIGNANRIVFAGGTVSFPSNSATIDVFDTSTETWTTSSLSQARYVPQAVAVLNQVLIGSGLLSCLSGCATSDVVDRFDASFGSATCSPATPNSTGASARLIAWGSDTIGGHPFELLAQDLPIDSFGYFLAAPGQGTLQPPGAQGMLCLAQPFAKLIQAGVPLERATAGSLRRSVDTLSIPLGGQLVAIAAGESWTFQAWFRDRNPGPTSNMTDALTVDF